MRMFRTVWFVLAASTIQSGAVADTSAFQIALRDQGLPTITRAIDVINEGSPREVSAGDDVNFSVRTGAEAVLQQGFQVRIFSLSSLASDPVQAGPAVEDCLVYFSTVYPVAPAVGPKIHLISNAAEGWLSVQPDNTVGHGYYLLVFERTGVTETVFRIKRSDAKAYFATGMRLVIKATARSRLGEVVAKNATREALRAADAGKLARTDDKLPCYRYEKVTRFAKSASAPEQLAMIDCSKSGQA